MPQQYKFIPATRADFPLLHAWLSTPTVSEFWGDPDHEISLIEEEIDGGDCKMHLVWGALARCGEARPFAFIQHWSPEIVDVPHMDDVPKGTRAIDTLLGEAEYLGQGHAKAYIRQYARKLLGEGAPLVVTDPRCDNPRGIATYRGAGFKQGPKRVCETGDMVYLMKFNGSGDKASAQSTPELEEQ